MSQQEDNLDVSVIVPVWNGRSTVLACIDALRRQTLPAARYEILIVDNGSTDDTRDLLEHEGVEALVEPDGGSYAARNLGLIRARGRFVAFTDADCVPAPDWLERMLDYAIAAGPDLGVVAGEIVIAGEATADANLYERVFAFRQRFNIDRGQCVTANWMSPVAVLRKLGPFDPRARSGGDWRMSKAIRDAGYKLVFASSAIVTHPPRATLGEIARKRRRVAGGRWVAARNRRLLPALSVETRDLAQKLIYAGRIRSLSVPQKVRLFGILSYLYVASIVEIIRLYRGADPART